MEKTLNTIQKIVKVGKVLSTIIFVFCLVGMALCVVGAICWRVFASPLLGNITINGRFIQEFGEGKNGVILGCAVGMIFLLGEAILSKAAQKYFRHELEDGTPFTLTGAKEMMRLGIKTMVIPVASYTAAMIVWMILRYYLHLGEGEFSQDITINLGLGIMFMIGSLLCRLGAQQNGETEPEEKKLEENYAEN